jgi:NAD(P)H-dependent flavin oxidoreductase YrpB (nitropropane dioxygenase family)
MASPQQLKTTATELLKIKHPVLLAGMNVAAGPKLAAAVTNAGGLGVIGGVRDSLAGFAACLQGLIMYWNRSDTPQICSENRSPNLKST